MPNRCCVTGCRSNYDGEEGKVSVFRFPKEQDRLAKWLSKIPRENFKPTSNSLVCEKHFSNEFIVRFDSATRPDGSVLTVKRQIPKLTDDAYPSIFPNCPSYLSSEPPSKRKKPEDRRKQIQQRDEDAFGEWLNADIIPNFPDFNSKVSTRVGDMWLYRLHATDEQQYVSLYFINDVLGNTGPQLTTAIRVFDDLRVEVFTENAVRVPDVKLKWLFDRKQTPSTLTSWSQFDALISHYSSTKKNEVKDQMQLYIGSLHELCSNDDMMDNEEDGPKTKLLFLIEQLQLLFSTQKRYTCETLIWAFKIYSSSPSSYSLLRQHLLTLPNCSYLRRLASTFNIESGIGSDNLHQKYLKQRCQNLKDNEKIVILMLDEIHVASQLSYKSGKLEGSASNSSLCEANTAQVFMISSLMSKHKDVAAMFPVKNISAAVLQDLIRQILGLLFHVGYQVISIISDNNRVNRNAFTLMCDGTLLPFIAHPMNSSERLYFLFDSVHLFKCIRNNWLAQKDEEKTFIIPSFEDCNETRASFYLLRKLYWQEKSSLVKLAPTLNQRCLYPTSTEKQNVALMLKIFNEKNISALEEFEKVWKCDTSGTREFLKLMITLWTILNVKHPLKHIRLRNNSCKPIASVSDNNMEFIKSVVAWIKQWKNLKLKPREGIFSLETMFALEHTLLTLLDLTDYLINEKNFSYVLLGKLQTDNLEFRFSRYRQLSGSNFHISVQQILESEKKLKLMSMLKMVSASKGTLMFKDITDSLEAVKKDASLVVSNEYKHFMHVFSECDNMELNHEQSKALVFIAGYAASKVIPKTDCALCKEELVHERQEKPLQVEGTSECYTYLCAMDRGGLTWPSDDVVHAVSQTYIILQSLIRNQELEKQFLQSCDQRSLLLNLTSERLFSLGLGQGNCDSCERQFADLLFKCCRPAVNILLNNYSKCFSDKTASGNSARKLKTFNPRI